MKKYQIVVTITDGVDVDANSPNEALELAETIFREAGLMIGNAELDIMSVEELDHEN
jgi:hypothetical protein